MAHGRLEVDRCKGKEGNEDGEGGNVAGRVRIWLCLWSNIYSLRSRKSHIHSTSFRLLCFLTTILIVMLPLKIMTNPHFPIGNRAGP